MTSRLRQTRTSSPFLASLGASLRNARNALNLTQREVAARSGIRPDRLTRYEAGEQPPSVQTLVKIAETLGRPVESLLPEIKLGGEEADRELYQMCRRAWHYPAPVRAGCATLLRGFLACTDFVLAKGGERDGSPRW